MSCKLNKRHYVSMAGGTIHVRDDVTLETVERYVELSLARQAVREWNEMVDRQNNKKG